MNIQRRIECVAKAERSETELSALIDDIQKTNLLSGDSFLIPKYEEALCRYFNVTHAIAVSSGTAALHASLSNVIQPGDEVLLPVIGVTMTASAIMMAGGIPVFYDCEHDSFKPNLSSLDAVATTKTRVLITVSMWGHSAIDDNILTFANDKKWLVMEDAAQSFGTRNNGQLEGTSGHIGCFSTQEFKLLSTGEGGFVLTDDSDYAKSIKSYIRVGFSDQHKAFGYHCGLNYRLSAMHASLGLGQLAIASEKIEKRNKKAALWEKMLGLFDKVKVSDHPLQLFDAAGRSGHNGYALCLRLSTATEEMAMPVLNKLYDAGVETDIHRYKQRLLVNYPYLKHYYNGTRYTTKPYLDFPNASKIMDSLIPLPCHDAVSYDDIEWGAKRVIDCLESALT